MADSAVTGLTAVVTPALTDEHAVRQLGDTRDKRESNTQLKTLINTNPSFAGTGIDCNDIPLNRPEIKDYAETKTDVAVVSNVATFNLENGNVFKLNQDANITTFTISNPAATGKGCSFTVIRVKDNNGTTRTITWPASVKWGGGVAPVLTQTANAVDIFTFFTIDAGTTWYGCLVGAAFA